MVTLRFVSFSLAFISCIAAANAQEEQDVCAPQLAQLQQQWEAAIMERDQALQQRQAELQQTQEAAQNIQAQAEQQLGQLQQMVQQLEGQNAELQSQLKDAEAKAASAPKSDASGAEVEKLKSTLKQKTSLLMKAEEQAESCGLEKSKLMEDLTSCTWTSTTEVGLGVKMDDNCETCTVDLTLFTRIYTILYKNTIEPYYDDMYVQTELVRAMVVDYSTTAFTMGKDLTLVALTEGGAFYTTTVDPYRQDLLKEAKVFYKANLEEAVKPLVEPMMNAVGEELDVVKLATQTYDAVVLIASDGVDLVKKEVLPSVKGFLKSINLEDLIMNMKPADFSLSSITEIVFQPILLPLFDETVEFRNGALDLVVLLFVTVFGSYYILYKFLLKFVLLTVVLKWVVYKILIMNLVAIAFKIIGKSIELVWGIFCLMLCCGCCGLCLRRSNNSKKTGMAKKQQGMGVSKGKPMNVQGNGQMPKKHR